MTSVAGLHPRFTFPEYNLYVFLLSGVHQICILAFPFDLPMQCSSTHCHHIIMLLSDEIFNFQAFTAL